MDIRRTKIKLKLLEQTEGVGWIVADILDMYNGNGTSADAPEIVEQLKQDYKREIGREEPPIQIKLEL